jgi:hypothetical protein
MMTTLLSIYEIHHALERLLELMLMIFAPMIALTMLYITIGRPMLRAARRARLNERERQIEHQKFLRYKFDNKYNHQSTRVGEEAQQLSDIKKEV